MAFSAGSVSATLSGNFSAAGFLAFDSAMRRSAATMDAQEKRMTAAGTRGSRALAAVGKVGAVAAVAGLAGFAIAVGKSVKVAADFEQELSRLKATTGANAAQMDLMKKSAMEAGAATKFSALDAAKAQTELAKGGLAVADIAGGGLKAALYLAAAGEMDLADAAGTVVNAMKQFKLPAEDAVHVADALATAANTTTADVDHFAQALTQGGAAAKAAGLDIDETIAVLEAFADNSVKGSDAGTSMKTMLTQLASPTDKQAAAAKRLNLELWNQNGRLKSLPAIAKELDDAFGGLTKQQQLAAAKTLAGTDGMRGLLAMYASSPAKMRAYLDGLKEEGTAAATAAEKQDNLRGKIENLKGSLKTARIALGTGLLGPLSDGAESLTASLNRMAASGELEQMGQDIGNVVQTIVTHAPGAASAISDIASALSGLGDIEIGDNFREFTDNFLGDITGIGEGIVTVLKGMDLFNNAMTGGLAPDIDTSRLERGIDKINTYRETLRDEKSQPKIKIGVTADIAEAQKALQTISKGGAGITKATLKILADDAPARSKIKALVALGISPKVARVLAEVSPALKGVKTTKEAMAALRDKSISIKTNAAAAAAAIRKIDNSDVKTKVLTILGRDISASAKVKQIRALGIPAKTARLLADSSNALAGVAAVRGMVASLPASKTVTLTTVLRTIRTGGALGAVGKAARGGNATGRGPGSAERSLVAEGRAPELVGNPDDGWAWVTQPTIMDLRPQDAVIPTDPQYSGRALGFMLAALGVPGYAKGKAPAKKKAAKPLPIPDAVRYGAVPEDQLNKERDDAREAYQKRKERIHDLDVDIREQRKRVGEAKKGPAKTKARRKLADLQADRKRYANGGSGVPNSLAELRAKWEDLKRQFTALHRTNLEIERLNKQQETDRTLMATASKKGDAAGWTKARDHRSGLLATLRDMYARAVKLAKPDSNFRAELEGQLAGIESEIADAAGEAFTPADAASRLADTGMTDAERSRLAQLEARQALAGLTSTLEDDKAAAGEIAGFFEGILGAVQSDPARGGAASVKAIAEQLKQARDNVASFAAGGAGNDNADLQAQLTQRDEQLRVATENARINAAALTVFQGWQGGGGPGGANAGVVVNQTVNTLHPGDARTLEAIGSAATAGQSQQASRISPRTYLGI